MDKITKAAVERTRNMRLPSEVKGGRDIAFQNGHALVSQGNGLFRCCNRNCNARGRYDTSTWENTCKGDEPSTVDHPFDK